VTTLDRTSAGKHRAAQNGRARQASSKPASEMQRELAGVADLIKQMRDARLS